MANNFIGKKFLDKIKEVVLIKRAIKADIDRKVPRDGPRENLKKITHKGITYKCPDGSYAQGFTKQDILRETNYDIYDLIYNGYIPKPEIEVILDSGHVSYIYTSLQAKAISHFIIDFYNKPKMDKFFKYIKDKGLKYE